MKTRQRNLFIVVLIFTTISVVSASETVLRLSLSDAVDIALARNIDMQNEILTVHAGESVLRAALSPWTPKMSFNADTIYSQPHNQDFDSTTDYQLKTDISKRFAWTGGTLSAYSSMLRHDNESGLFMQDIQGDAGLYTTALGLRLSQPLLKNAGLWNDRITLQRSRLLFENTLYRYLQARRRMILDVVVMYFSTLKQEKLVDVAQRSVRDAEMHAQNTLIKLEEGLVAQMDVSQAELQLARQRTTLIRSRQNAAAMADALKLALNMPLDTGIELTESTDHTTETVDLQAALEEALSRRLELLMLKNDVRIAEQAVTQAMNQRMPALDLVLSAESVTRDDRFSDTFRFENDSYNVRAGFSYTLGDRSNREAWTQARIQLQRTGNDLENRTRVIEKEVRDEIRHYRALTEALNVSARSLSIAERNLELATESYREGLTGNLDLIKAQDDLITAGTSYYSDILDLAVAKARILYVIGRDIDPSNLTLQGQQSLSVPDAEHIRLLPDPAAKASEEHLE